MTDADQQLDDTVKAADPDRWLAARFIGDEAARAEVVALYAFNHELARATEVARDALMGEIRLTWWREAMEEIASGKTPRRHPLVETLAASAFDPEALAALAEGRLADLESDRFAEEGEALAYIDATAGALMHLAARRLDPAAGTGHTRAAARAWALSGLARAGKASGRPRLPDWSDRGLLNRVSAAVATANRDLKGLPAAAFPAVAYAALSARYLAGKPVGELERRARLTWAVLRGRL